MHAVFIPSKGRPACRTALELARASQKFFIVIEPQDFEAYVEAGWDAGKLLLLGENDRGLAFARQSILYAAQKLQHEWFWMIDDDLRKFEFCFPGGQREEVDFKTALEFIESSVCGIKKLAAASPDYCFNLGVQQVPSQRRSVEVAVLMRTKIVNKFKYEPRLVPKEDRDFALQLRAAGYRTVVETGVKFTPMGKIGEISGGLQSVYRGGQERRAVELLAEKWPSCVRKMVKRGRVDAKIDWLAADRLAQLQRDMSSIVLPDQKI